MDYQRPQFHEPKEFRHILCAEVGACAKGLKWFLACGILMQMRTLLQVRPNTIAFDSEAREIHGNQLGVETCSETLEHLHTSSIWNVHRCPK